MPRARRRHASPALAPGGVARTRRAGFEMAMLLGAIVVGIVARFVLATPLWLDEALSVNIADRPLGQIGEALRHDGHPPLYYYVLSLWMKVFGTSDAAVRGLSALFGVLAIVLVVIVCRRHQQRELSTFAAFVLAISPYAVRYSSETRMYSMVMVLVLAGWIAMTWAAEQPSVLRLLPLPFVAGALALTHYWSFYLLGATVLLLVVHAWFVPSDRRACTRMAIAISAGAVFFVPWLGAFFYQLQHTGTPWAPRSRPTRVVSESLIDFAGGLDPEPVLLLVLLSLLVVVGIFGRRDGRLTLGRTAEPWVANTAAIATLTVALGALASFAGNSAFAGRYAAVYFPMFVVCAALGLVALGQSWVRTCAVAAVALLSLAGIVLAIDRDRTQVGQLADIINAEGRTGDLVVACPDQLGPSLRRVVRDDVEVVRYPDLGDAHVVDWVDYKARLGAADPAQVAAAVAQRVAPDRTVWLVFSSGYRVVEAQCDQLVDALAVLRPVSRILAQPDGAAFFETAALRRFDRA